MEFVLPPSWHRTFYPRRGGAPLPYKPIGTPLPAGWRDVFGTPEGRGIDERAVAEHWIATDGPARAARTATGHIRRPLLSRVRTALAAAPPQVYSEALDELRQARTESLEHRLAAAFLAPTEGGWVERDLADLPDRHPPAPLLAASVSTVDQARLLLDRLAPTQAEQLREPELLHTLAEGIGDGILDVYARLWTGRSIEYTMAGVPEYLAAMLEALPSIPTERAFLALLDRAGERGGAAAVMQAADRFPALALRLLQANAARPKVADLLRRHTAKHPPRLQPPGPAAALAAPPQPPGWTEPGPAAALAAPPQPPGWTEPGPAAALAAPPQPPGWTEPGPAAALPAPPQPPGWTEPGPAAALAAPPQPPGWTEPGPAPALPALPQLPAGGPRVPGWAEPGTLPPVALRGGAGALPADTVRHLVRVLMADGEIGSVRAACEPYDLARLGWELFCRWESAGAPPAGAWALRAQALLGDDLTAAGLAEAAGRWASEGAHRRAAAALDALRHLGTEAALRHLHELATTARSKAVRARAAGNLGEVARGLGLTADALADRLVPRFGLSPDATMVVDHGSQRFVAGFDEQLRPYVTDEHGTRRKDLPAAARAGFTATRRGVRKVATEQARRLEAAMSGGRRWEAAEFRTAILDHPLLWPLARRLVWLTGRPGSPGTSLRLAEDRTFADLADDPADLPPGTVLGVAHPADLDVPAWLAVFADYGILQPFPQLHRPVYRLSPDESAAARLARFDDRRAPAVKLLALEDRGWRRAGTGSHQSRLERDRPDGRRLVVELDPGLTLGRRPDHHPDQRLRDVWICPAGEDPGSAAHTIPFSALDAAAASELLADLSYAIEVLPAG
ncbi:DUF4132 domain-containing protein [Dactylosporangium sp. McL0621]|uniref:DUF4132 domain-containing protein n=1 Tax=Dactylosporangium sp. McL0621 TaxID=3415678 RepID=UPI003CFA3C2D